MDNECITFHEFMDMISSYVKLKFPNTEIVMKIGSDLPERVVMELRQGDLAMEYYPWECLDFSHLPH